MALAPGTRIGPYEIAAPIGAGGMGEVYRARDTKLNRDVAIKVLPAAFAEERERVSRFEREAQTLAALNHQNIAQVFGVIEQPLGLVMELVEGQDLSSRIGARGMRLDEALPIARQIAEALEAAHERGVVHRDLKPANVKVRDDGVVKVLDFGLAKAMDSGSAASALANSPTFMTGATQIGTILGTAAYMSPEQARGKTVDKRSDIWSFGAVLFEMLAGRRPFEGDTITEILGAIIHKAPDLSLLPAPTPAPIVALIARCLEKDVTRRLRDIGEARLALESSSASLASHLSAPVPVRVSARPSALRRAALPAAIAVALALGIAIGAIAWPRNAPAVTSLHAAIPLPEGFFVTASPVISPDGSVVAFTGITERDGTPTLYLRGLDAFDTRPVAGSEGAGEPFFSPDSRFVAFFANGALRQARVSDGTVSTIVPLPRLAGGSWGADGNIVFSLGIGSGIQRVSAKGGAIEQLTSFREGEYAHVWPQVLENGDIMYKVWGTWSYCSLVKGTREPVCVPAQHNVRFGVDGYALTDGQYTGVAAYKLGSRPLEGIEGEGEMVLRSVFYSPTNDRGFFSLSKTGTFVYVPGNPQARRLAWVGADGATTLLTDQDGNFGRVSLSPDGRRILYGGGGEISVLDVERGTRAAITSGGSTNLLPFWSRDGKRVFFSSNRDGRWAGYVTSPDAGGKVVQILEREYDTRLESEGPDGSLLLTIVDPKTSTDIWLMRPGGALEPVVIERQVQSASCFSPSGRHFAYVSNASGRPEVHMRALAGGETVQVSTKGGTRPAWSRDGAWLYYSQAATIMRVSIDAAGRPGLPQALMHRPDLNGVSDTSLDGKRFLVETFLPESIPSEIRIITNFIDEIRRAVK